MQIYKSNLKNFLVKNKWIILSALFFIILKFYLIGVLWHGRDIPPEADDAYIYISHIASVENCPSFLFCSEAPYSIHNYSFFEHLTYRLFFGTIGKITHLSPAEIFHLSFYIGVILLLPSLIFLLKSLGLDSKSTAFALFFLALYNGSAYYQGFWWIVPTFFATIIFFFILGITFNNKISHWKLKLFLLSLLILLTHPLGIYFTISLIPLCLFYSLFSFSIQKDCLRKVLFSLVITLLLYLPLSFYLHNYTLEGNPFGIENSLISLTKKYLPETSSESPNNYPIETELSPKKELTNNIFPSFKIINNYYFKWIFFSNLFGLIPFCLITFLLGVKNHYALLSIYFSLLVILIAASLNEYGYRFLILLWPITYAFYAVGIWEIIRYLNQHNQELFWKSLKYALFGFIFMFSMVNIIYAYLFNKFMSNLENIEHPSLFTNYIVSDTQSKGKIYLKKKILLTYLETTVLKDRITSQLDNADYYVTLKDNYYTIKNTKLYELYTYIAPLINITTEEEPVLKKRTLPPSNFILEKEFNDIRIYKRVSN